MKEKKRMKIEKENRRGGEQGKGEDTAEYCIELIM